MFAFIVECFITLAQCIIAICIFIIIFALIGAFYDIFEAIAEALTTKKEDENDG